MTDARSSGTATECAASSADARRSTAVSHCTVVCISFPGFFSPVPMKCWLTNSSSFWLPACVAQQWDAVNYTKI